MDLKKHISLIATLSFTFIFSSAFADSSKNILIVGDSHSYGPYGAVLDNFYRNQGHKVSSYASCGSSPSTWARSSSNFQQTNCGYWSKSPSGKETRVNSHKLPSFQEALNQSQPDLTIISLGTNALSSPQNIQNEVRQAERLMDSIKKANSECVWIGPPDNDKKPFSTNLAQGVVAFRAAAEKNGCKFIDSTKYTKYPKGKSDGIHYGPKDSKAWGEGVVKELAKIDIKANSVSSSGSAGREKTSSAAGVR